MVPVSHANNEENQPYEAMAQGQLADIEKAPRDDQVVSHQN